MSEGEQPRKLCFVIGPIGAEESQERLHADWLLEEIIDPVFRAFPEFRVERADKLSQPGLIDAQVINLLLTAELAIADLSTLNPNAFYEIGIRHMAQKPIIHMHRFGESIPFDVKLYRSIPFAVAKPADLRAARNSLKAQVRAVLAPEYQVENPVTNAMGRVQLEKHATPEQRVLIEEINRLTVRISALEQRTTNFSSPEQKSNTISSEINHVFVDLTEFQGDIQRIYIGSISTVAEFLNDVYEMISRFHPIEPFTYGRAWVLRDVETQHDFSEMGTLWARNQGALSDDRFLSSVGIRPGSILKALRLKRVSDDDDGRRRKLSSTPAFPGKA